MLVPVPVVGKVRYRWKDHEMDETENERKDDMYLSQFCLDIFGE